MGFPPAVDAATPLTPSYSIGATPGTTIAPGTVNAYASPHIPDGTIPNTPGDLDFNAGTPMGNVDAPAGGMPEPGQIRYYKGALVSLQDKTLAEVQSVGEGGSLSVRCGTLQELEKNAMTGMPLDVNEKDVVAERPKKRDPLIILGGENAGQRGSLIGQSGEDGIVKLEANANDSNPDILIIEVKYLAKVILT